MLPSGCFSKSAERGFANCPAILPILTTGTPPPNMATTAIWRSTRKVSRMRLAEKSPKDSAQSPPEVFFFFFFGGLRVFRFYLVSAVSDLSSLWVSYVFPSRFVDKNRVAKRGWSAEEQGKKMEEEEEEEKRFEVEVVLRQEEEDEATTRARERKGFFLQRRRRETLGISGQIRTLRCSFPHSISAEARTRPS